MARKNVGYDSGPVERAYELRKARREYRVSRGLTILFPKDVVVTPCKTRTYTYLERTPHGVIRKESTVTLMNGIEAEK